MFRLKSLEIYLSPENDTAEKIAEQLYRLKIIQITYVVVMPPLVSAYFLLGTNLFIFNTVYMSIIVLLV